METNDLNVIIDENNYAFDSDLLKLLVEKQINLIVSINANDKQLKEAISKNSNYFSFTETKLKSIENAKFSAKKETLNFKINVLYSFLT